MVAKVRETIGNCWRSGIRSRPTTCRAGSRACSRRRCASSRIGRNCSSAARRHPARPAPFQRQHPAARPHGGPRDGVPFLHLTGTKYFEAITDEAFLATRDVWDQEVVSENRRCIAPSISRGSAARGAPSDWSRESAQNFDGWTSRPRLTSAATPFRADERLAWVQEFMGRALPGRLHQGRSRPGRARDLPRPARPTRPANSRGTIRMPAPARWCSGIGFARRSSARSGAPSSRAFGRAQPRCFPATPPAGLHRRLQG
jgi:hypothetical protein